MDDFETFKAGREKIDPSSRKFSETQWQEAYAAYKSSRKRVSVSRSSGSGESSKRRRTSSRGSSSSSSSRQPALTVQSPVEGLKHEVRQSSAYRDLRMILDILAWVAIGVVVLSAAIKLIYYTDPAVALASIADAAFKVVAVVVIRLLAHAIIDIPDIALHERAARSAPGKQPSDDNE